MLGWVSLGLVGLSLFDFCQVGRLVLNSVDFTCVWLSLVVLCQVRLGWVGFGSVQFSSSELDWLS